jgi:4-hydroxybenzoate polyprenyltransferase
LNILLRICDYIFVLRPLILIPAWSFFLIGAQQGPGPNGFALGSVRFFEFVSLTSISIVAYLINQIFDRESDEKNNKCFYLWQGIFTVRTLVLLAIVFFFLASWAFRRVGEGGQIILLALLVLSLLYSLPPVRLCARPFADLIANAVGYGGLAFLLGYGPYPGVWPHAFVHATPYVLLVAATFVHTAILDREGDEATGKISTAVVLGESASRKLALALHALAVVTALADRSAPALIVALVSFPLAGYAFLARTPTAGSFYVQGITLVVAVAAMIMWPAFAILVVPLVVLSWFYHRRRFGLNYPGRRKTA